jgi:hypothetical protein
MFINRDWQRSEEDDFKLNVLPRLDSGTEAVPCLCIIDKNVRSESGQPILSITGWHIQPRGE